MSKNTKTVIILLVIAVLIAALPLFALKDADAAYELFENRRGGVIKVALRP